jgi:phage recombination protein Bet
MNSLELATKYETTKEEIDLIKEKFAKGASDIELHMFLMQCKRTGLDCASRQIYLVPRWDSKLGKNVFATQVSIDGARLIAQRSGEYEGQVGPFWCGEDGVWTDVWLKKEAPLAAKVGIFRKGFRECLYSVANFDAYCQKSKDGRPTHMWNQFSALMIAKVAEMLSLRRAFPQELSGLYSTEEMQQSEVVDVTPVKVEPKKEIPQSSVSDMIYDNKSQLANVLKMIDFKFDETGKALANEMHDFCVTNKMTIREMSEYVTNRLKEGVK